MSNNIKIKRGLKAGLPNLEVGEFGLATDTNEVFIGTPTGNKLVNGGGGGTVDWQDVENKPELQEKLIAGANITINPVTNVISASGAGGGGEVNLDEMAYFNFAGNIYGAKYSLLLSAWEHSLIVDPLEISQNTTYDNPRGTAQYPNGVTEGVIIPQGVTRIGNNAFRSWQTNNQPLVIPNSVTSIGNSAFNSWNTNNQPLIIPSGVKSIGQGAFADWKVNNQPLVIPDSVTSIGSVAFRYWFENSHPVTIPRGVTSIGYEAFAAWYKAKEFIMESETPPTIDNSFSGTNGAPFYVPNGSVQAYKTAPSWVDLADRIFPMHDRNNGEGVIPEAPEDGKLYGRKDAEWSEISDPEDALRKVTTQLAIDLFGGTDGIPLIEYYDMYTSDVMINLDEINYKILIINGFDVSYFDLLNDGVQYELTNAYDFMFGGATPIWRRRFGISSGGGGGITKKTVSIPFTEVWSETITTIEVTYSYLGDDPVNFTADFSNFALGNALSLVMPDIGEIPISMIVQLVFGKTILNYFEIIILFRYIISATLARVILVDSSYSNTASEVLMRYALDYQGFVFDSTVSPDTFHGINDMNINGATFTVDFMVQCQDIPFYNTVTGRGSDMSVVVETAGEVIGVSMYEGIVVDNAFNSMWENYIKPDDDTTTNAYEYVHYISGMTLKLSPNIKMRPNYSNGIFWLTN